MTEPTVHAERALEGERSRLVSWHDPARSAEAAAELSGLEFLRALRDGRIPPPPIASVLGFALVAVEPGRVEFACRPDESAYNPIGLVHGGLVCTLADSAAGCALQSLLEAGVGYTTIDLHVSFLRSVTAGSGELRAVGTVTKHGRRVGFAEVVVVDPDGRTVATATSSLLVIDRRSPAG